MGEELKPCPFCGGEAKLRIFPDEQVDGYNNYWVECDGFCTTYPSTACHHEESIAVEEWNTRQASDEAVNGKEQG